MSDFIDRSAKVKAQLDANMQAALHAVGIRAMRLIHWQMEWGYGKPIRITGDLQRDVTYEVRPESNSVRVGNGSIHYSHFVHEGTYKMKARPYIQDGILGGDNPDSIQEIAEFYLKQGF